MRAIASPTVPTPISRTRMSLRITFEPETVDAGPRFIPPIATDSVASGPAIPCIGGDGPDHTRIRLSRRRSQALLACIRAARDRRAARDQRADCRVTPAPAVRALRARVADRAGGASPAAGLARGGRLGVGDGQHEEVAGAEFGAPSAWLADDELRRELIGRQEAVRLGGRTPEPASVRVER